MSQINVERVIGLLVTDEAFRRRFQADPRATLEALTSNGMELTPCELGALLTIDSRLTSRFADALDPRLQKTDLRGCAPREKGDSLP